MIEEYFVATDALADAAGISPQMARKACRQALAGKLWRDCLLRVRVAVSKGGGGKSGLRYEVLLSSLPQALQTAFRGDLEPSHATAIVPYAAPVKFIAAPFQTAEEERRYDVLRHILTTEPGTKERGEAVRAASHHHGEPVRTIYRWLKQLAQHGGDLDALGRKRPANAGKPRVKLYKAFDDRFRAAGYRQPHP